MKQSRYKYIGFAESHVAVDKVEQQRAELERRGWRSRWCPARPSSKSTTGSQGGTVSLRKPSQHITALQAELGNGSEVQKLLRDALDWTVDIVHLQGFKFAIFTCYFECGIGFPKSNLVRLAQLETVVRLLQLPFLILADWNATFDELLATGWVQRVAGEPVLPDVEFTRRKGKRLIDFGVASRTMKIMLVYLYTAIGDPWKPHFGLIFGIRLKPLEVHITTVIEAPTICVDKPLQVGAGEVVWETCWDLAFDARPCRRSANYFQGVLAKNLVAGTESLSAELARWTLACEMFFFHQGMQGRGACPTQPKRNRAPKFKEVPVSDAARIPAAGESRTAQWWHSVTGGLQDLGHVLDAGQQGSPRWTQLVKLFDQWCAEAPPAPLKASEERCRDTAAVTAFLEHARESPGG